MRKLLTFFVAILATTALLAQNYDFQVGDLKYRVTSAEEPYTVEVVGCAPDVASVEIPSSVVGPYKLAISHESLVMYEGDEFQVEATMGGVIVNAEWTSADEYVATVEDGLIKAINEGATVITAVYNGQIADVRVYVEKGVEELPYLPLPGAGKVTICVQVPEPLCEGSFVVIPGSLTSWNTGDAVSNGQATQLIEGTNNWYAGTFDWQPDYAFKIAHCKPNGTWEWVYQAASGELLEGDLSYYGEITSDMVINSDNQVIYIRVDAWEASACEKLNEAGTATFNLTAVNFPATAQFAIAGSGLAAGAWACPPPTEHIMTNLGEGQYTLTLDVPAEFQYKYLVDLYGDGSWQWFSFANYNMPLSLVTNDTERYDAWSINGKKDIISSENNENTITYAVTGINGYAFTSNPSITSITISDGVEYIGIEAFSYCSALQYLSIPSSVQYSFEIFEDYYGQWTEYYNGFYSILGCNNLKTLIVPADFFGVNDYQYAKSDLLPYLPEKLEALTINGGNMDHRFGWDFINRNRKSLKHIDLGATENLAEEAFQNFYNLESLILPSTIETIPYMAIAECVKLQSITIPAAVTEIEDRAFENCRMLSSVNFAEDGALTRIGNWAFYNNHELTNLVIPEGVTEVGHAAFYGCTYLAEMTLPSTVQEIADNGFALCGKLKRMNVAALVPPTVATRTFEEVDRSIPVYVPDEVVDIYKSAPVWQEFNIQGKSNAPTGVENTHSSSPMTDCQKVIHNGQLLILRDGKMYSIMGQEL